MKKFIGKVSAPINFHSTSRQASELRESPRQLTVKVVITDDGLVFVNTEKHKVGVINQRTAGGKWIERKPSRYESLEQYMEKIGAVESSFRGSPRV
ncbi:MAG: hypothetical protein R3309_17175 [Reinekea sp.]|nr:hypothetical protein [Reinekea sp.]